MAGHGDHGHALHAAGDDNLAHAGDDLLGGIGDGLQAAGAEAADGLPGDAYGQTCSQRSNATDVHALLGFGQGAT